MKNSTLSVLLFVSFLGLSAGVLRAQDDLRSVQEELRRRSLYFGDVNGQNSPELQEATKRYQKGKGFAATGKPDRETLKSLGLLRRSANEPVPADVSWPDEPVLPSDEKIDTVAVAVALNEETGIAPGAVVAKDSAARAKAAVLKARAKNPANSASVAAPAVQTEQQIKNSPVITPNELAKFARDYFAAMSSNDIKRQLKFYSDKVKYYQNGLIDRRIVEQTVRRYQARWPHRRYTIGDVIHYSRINSRGEITLTFPISFILKDGQRTVRGQTNNQLTISAGTVDPRIASISEQRIRR